MLSDLAGRSFGPVLAEHAQRAAPRGDLPGARDRLPLEEAADEARLLEGRPEGRRSFAHFSSTTSPGTSRSNVLAGTGSLMRTLSKRIVV